MKGMTPSQKWKLATFLSLVSLTPGPIGFLIYQAVVSSNPSVAAGLSENWTIAAQVVSGFTFTMLGFLAALITVLFGFSNTAAFRRYQRKGQLDTLFLFYYFTILCLVGTALISLWNLSGELFVWPFRIMLMMTVNNLVQIAMLAWMICAFAMAAGKRVASLERPPE